MLRSKGKVTLASRLSFMLMVSDDRTWQAKRDKWVKTKLEAIIKSGRADKAVPAKVKSPSFRRVDLY